MAEQRVIAAAAKFGVPIETDPEQALLDLVAESAGLVHFYRTRIEELIGGHDKEVFEPDGRFDAVAWQANVGPITTGAGMLGPVYQLDREGNRVRIGEDVRAFVKLYNEERDRLAKVAKAAIDAGIAKRQVEQAQRFGDQMVMVIVNVFSRLGLSADVMAAARSLIAQEFRALAIAERSAPRDVTPVRSRG